MNDFNGNLDLQIDLDSGYYDEELPTCEDCGKDLHGEQERAWERCKVCHAEMEIRDEEYDPGEEV